VAARKSGCNAAQGHRRDRAFAWTDPDRIRQGAGSTTSNPSERGSHHETQTAETHIRIAHVNRFNALGSAEIEAIA
jgi:hypothetical protein